MIKPSILPISLNIIVLIFLSSCGDKTPVPLSHEVGQAVTISSASSSSNPEEAAGGASYGNEVAIFSSTKESYANMNKGVIWERIVEYTPDAQTEASIYCLSRIQAIFHTGTSAEHPGISKRMHRLLAKFLCGGKNYATFKDSCIIGSQSYKNAIPDIALTLDQEQSKVSEAILKEIVRLSKEGLMSILLLDLNRAMVQLSDTQCELTAEVSSKFGVVDGNAEWILVANPYSYGVQNVCINMVETIEPLISANLEEQKRKLNPVKSIFEEKKNSLTELEEILNQEFSQRYHLPNRLFHDPMLIIQSLLRDRDPNTCLKVQLEQKDPATDVAEFCSSIPFFKNQSANAALLPFLNLYFDEKDQKIYYHSFHKTLVYVSSTRLLVGEGRGLVSDCSIQ